MMHNDYTHLKAICEKAYSSPVSITVCDYDHFVTPIQ